MEHYRCQKSYTPETRAEIISDTVEFPPKKFNMAQMSSMDATNHAAQVLVYALQNPAPEIPLVKLGNVKKEALMNLAEIYRKENPPSVPPRVPVREVGQKKLQEVNQEGTQMKSSPQ